MAQDVQRFGSELLDPFFKALEELRENPQKIKIIKNIDQEERSLIQCAITWREGKDTFDSFKEYVDQPKSIEKLTAKLTAPPKSALGALGARFDNWISNEWCQHIPSGQIEKRIDQFFTNHKLSGTYEIWAKPDDMGLEAQTSRQSQMIGQALFSIEESEGLATSALKAHEQPTVLIRRGYYEDVYDTDSSGTQLPTGGSYWVPPETDHRPPVHYTDRIIRQLRSIETLSQDESLPPELRGKVEQLSQKYRDLAESPELNIPRAQRSQAFQEGIEERKALAKDVTLQLRAHKAERNIVLIKSRIEFLEKDPEKNRKALLLAKYDLTTEEDHYAELAAHAGTLTKAAR